MLAAPSLQDMAVHLRRALEQPSNAWPSASAIDRPTDDQSE
jgi:hypothetical protein